MTEGTMPFSDSEMEQLDARMAHAVSKGLRDVITDREAVRAFWSGAFEVASEQTKLQAGGFVLDKLSWIATRGLMFFMAGTLIYALGGWSALVSTWRALFGGPPDGG